MALEDDIAARDLTALVERLEALKVAFDRYFLGLEKRPPLQKRDQLARDLRRFRPSNDAVVRFKWQNLVQRQMTYNRMWERIMKAIEDGTYERDVKRADWRERQKKKDPAEVAPERARAASAKAKGVGDEAAAFMASLAVPMRGKPVGEPAGEGRRPSSPSIAVPMRGRGTNPPSSPPRPAPVPSRPPPSAAPVPRSTPPAAPPMRGAPKGPLPPLPPMRGRPVREDD